jgi:hypothetical protein
MIHRARACVAIARLCGISPGAPIGGCDAPQAVSIAAAAQLRRAQRPNLKSSSLGRLLKPERADG